MRLATVFAFVLTSLLAVTPVGAKGWGGSHFVRSYTTHKGTTVQSHRRTNPDSSRSNNWSTRGNVNPYTGKAGTKSPWRR